MSNAAVFLGGASAATAASGALQGDGSLLNPLAVRVDGATVTINGSNALEATGGGGGGITSPLQIPDCALWLDASQLTLDDDDPVSLWPDASGNGYDATQATSSQQPVFKAAQQNALGVVRFAYVDDTPQYLALPETAAGLVRNTPGVTVAIVAMTTNHYLGTALFASNNDGTKTRLMVVAPYSDTPVGQYAQVSVSNNDTVEGSSGATGAALPPGPSSTPVSDWITGMEFRPTTSGMVAMVTVAQVSPTVWAQAVPTVAYTPAGVVNLTPGVFPDTDSTLITVGSDNTVNNAFSGDIAEIVVYPRVLSSWERRALAEYLSSKWGTI